MNSKDIMFKTLMECIGQLKKKKHFIYIRRQSLKKILAFLWRGGGFGHSMI